MNRRPGDSCDILRSSGSVNPLFILLFEVGERFGDYTRLTSILPTRRTLAIRPQAFSAQRSLCESIFMDVSLRPYHPQYFEYARGLYFETMRWAIERVFGSDQAREESSFAEWFKPDEVQIVVVDGIDAGWIQWRADDQAVSLGSIYIAPAMQRKGIGTRVIRMISECATRQSQPMILAVMKINPALGFYERLGFRVTHEDDYKFYLRSGASTV